MAANVIITVRDEGAAKAVTMADVMTSPSYFAVFLRTIGAQHFRDRAIARFSREGDSASGQWQPLTEATIDIRDQYGFPPYPINVRTGDLKRAVTTARGTVRAMPLVGAELEWPASSDLQGPEIDEKFTTAQVGSPPQTTRGFGPTPPRPVVAANEEDLAMLVELLSAQLKMSLERGMEITINATAEY